MDKSKMIHELLKKFKEKTLTPAEARELIMALKKGSENEDFNVELEELWRIAETDDMVNVPSEKMLSQVKQKLGNDFSNVKSGKEPSLIRLIRNYYRYAALIVLTAGLTWFGQYLSNRRFEAVVPEKTAESSYEVFVPYGSKTRIVLPDGSAVTLNSGSYLKYPATYSSANRYAYIQGEGFFDIKKDRENPFIISTGEITIKVLGTKFNVKSYTDEKTVETTLVSGTIEITPNQASISDKSGILILKPNQQAIFEKQTGKLVISQPDQNVVNNKIKPVDKFRVQKKIDVVPVIAWKDHKLVFRDESFKELSRKLERWYDVEIEIQDENLGAVMFSGVFERETFEQALVALQLATPFEYKMDKNKVTILK